MSENFSDMPEAQGGNLCHRCDGTGTVAILIPACCGRLTQGGECRGDCAIPEEKPDECPDCNGRGVW